MRCRATCAAVAAPAISAKWPFSVRLVALQVTLRLLGLELHGDEAVGVLTDAGMSLKPAPAVGAHGRGVGAAEVASGLRGLHPRS
jgi:hypothetical protein